MFHHFVMTIRLEAKYSVSTVQLAELLVVRHSVFILGNAGTGKSNGGRLNEYGMVRF